MAWRKRARKSIDRKIFKRTANSTKKINLFPCNMRGGIRL